MKAPGFLNRVALMVTDGKTEAPLFAPIIISAFLNPLHSSLYLQATAPSSLKADGTKCTISSLAALRYTEPPRSPMLIMTNWVPEHTGSRETQKQLLLNVSFYFAEN